MENVNVRSWHWNLMSNLFQVIKLYVLLKPDVMLVQFLFHSDGTEGHTVENILTFKFPHPMSMHSKTHQIWFLSLLSKWSGSFLGSSWFCCTSHHHLLITNFIIYRSIGYLWHVLHLIGYRVKFWELGLFSKLFCNGKQDLYVWMIYF